MIWVLLALLVLFTCLCINDWKENKKKQVVEKKPSDEWYAKKLSDIFYDWKIICDNKNSSRDISFHFKWKYYEWWKEKTYEHIMFWWELWYLMKIIYDSFKKKTDY